MSIWGKLASATAELSGSPIGTVLGSADAKEPAEIAFAVGVIALGAKMAKADGVVTVDEVNAFKTVFKVPEGEVKNVARVFNLAKQDATGYEAYAEQLAVMFKGNRKLREDVLEGLFHIAKADRVLHTNEERLLTQIAKRFGITETDFGCIKARHAPSTKRNPYDVLGVKPSRTEEPLPQAGCGKPSRQTDGPRRAEGVHRDRHREDRRHQRGLYPDCQRPSELGRAISCCMAAAHRC